MLFRGRAFVHFPSVIKEIGKSELQRFLTSPWGRGLKIPSASLEDSARLPGGPDSCFLFSTVEGDFLLCGIRRKFTTGAHVYK